MFTGIIEEIGQLKTISRRGNTLLLTISAKLILSDIHIGDSIAVNGVCLTVTQFNQSSFTADVMPVTFQTSNLSVLKPNSQVNLERAMAANGRFGGHIVSGHIDGIATIIEKSITENAILYHIKLPDELSHYCIVKGSIAIDGTSLTLVNVVKNVIAVALIPHTREKSILGNKNVGDSVNIECDILAKQLSSSKQPSIKKPSGLNESFLQEHGFI